jgi:hypothetical protein
LRSSALRLTFFLLFSVVLSAAAAGRAQAMPIFAQRYHFQCTMCHTVLPELNQFGNYFRNHGYQLPLPRHGTTVVAFRYQLEWEKDPPVGSNRFTPGLVLLANADFGRVAAYIHYNFGAQGGPAGLYLGYLATYNPHTQSLYRAGLFELPLAQSPGQRLDDLQQYGYYGTHVGLNDLALSAPRWGAQAERTIGATRVDLTFALGDFQGAPYGGKPTPTGETTSAETPELGFFVRSPLNNYIEFGGVALEGTRRIAITNGATFNDSYTRYGLLARAYSKRLELQAEQWWGHDTDIDSFGTEQGSAGGYVRLKYYPTPHSYLGIRYDAAANPIVVRDMVYYGAFDLTPHARLVVQQVQPIGGKGQLGAAITVGFPWPRNL